MDARRADLPKGAALVDEIGRLKHERNAIILAHYYQDPVIQDLADFVGDSLELSRKAAATNADVIAFYRKQAEAQGMKIVGEMSTPDNIILTAQQEGAKERSVQVTAAQKGGKVIGIVMGQTGG